MPESIIFHVAFGYFNNRHTVWIMQSNFDIKINTKVVDVFALETVKYKNDLFYLFKRTIYPAKAGCFFNMNVHSFASKHNGTKYFALRLELDIIEIELPT